MAPINASTWNTLGLCVATTYATLGASTIFFPWLTAETLGFRSLLEHAKADVPGVMGFIGGRDLSIGLAIFVLGRAGRNREMGTLILSSMFLCAIDTYVFWANGKRFE